MTVELLNCDCMTYMRGLPDNAFDLAIVDPPYGVEKSNKAPSRIQKHGQLKTANDLKSNLEYFAELFRVSQNQIVWGYNHLSDLLPKTKEFIFWFKHQPIPTYSDGELAWTSFTKTAKCFDFPFFGATGSDIQRIHPTQKPVILYQWLLENYAKPGQKILDTHLGSGSSAIAAHYFGCDFVGTELDPDYYEAACNRFNMATAQTTIFDIA